MNIRKTAISLLTAGALTFGAVATNATDAHAQPVEGSPSALCVQVEKQINKILLMIRYIKDPTSRKQLLAELDELQHYSSAHCPVTGYP